MNESQIEKARALKAQGFSFRAIAAELNIAVASLFRALKEEDAEPSPEVSSTPIDASSETTPETETPASPSLANGERPRSALLAERIVETQTQLATMETELAELPQRKELLLAAEELDRQALAALEEHGSRLAKEAELLRERIPLLENRKEGAEAEEAGKRLHEIVAEAERLQEQEAPLLAAFDEAVQALVARVQPIVELHKQHRELCSEEVYLVERYRLPRLGMPQLGDMPNAAIVFNKVSAAAAAVNGPESPWQRKRRRWEEERRTRPVVRRSEASSLNGAARSE